MKRRYLKRSIAVPFVIFVALSFMIPVSINAGSHSIANHSNNNAVSMASTSGTIIANSTAQFKYILEMGNGNAVTKYDVNTLVSFSGQNNNVRIHSTMTNATYERTFNTTFNLSDFKTFKNSKLYQVSYSTPSPFGNGSFNTSVISSASNHLVKFAYIDTVNSAENFHSIVSIVLVKSSGSNNLFENLNYNTTMAYLFIPQLLPPNLQGNGGSVTGNDQLGSTSPSIIPIPPGGGGGGGYTTAATGTLHEYDNTVKNIYLWEAATQVTVGWSAQGGSLSGWSATPGYGIYYNDWLWVSQTTPHSSTSSSFTYTYNLNLYANWPIDGFTQWTANPIITITEYNSGTCHIQISNTIMVWNPTTSSWGQYSSHTLYNSDVSNGAGVQVTQYLLNSIN